MMGYTQNLKREENTDTYSNIEKSHKYSVEGKKPDTKESILHVFIQWSSRIRIGQINQGW